MHGRSDGLIDDLWVEALRVQGVGVRECRRTFFRPGALLARTAIGQPYIPNAWCS